MSVEERSWCTVTTTGTTSMAKHVLDDVGGREKYPSNVPAKDAAAIAEEIAEDAMALTWNKVQIVSVDGYHGVRRRQPKLGLGDMATVTVKKGTPDMRRKLVKAVVIRQKKEIRRIDGLRLSFEDNAMVVTNERGEPRGTEIKGPVAREVAERFPKIGSMATIIV